MQSRASSVFLPPGPQLCPDAHPAPEPHHSLMRLSRDALVPGASRNGANLGAMWRRQIAGAQTRSLSLALTHRFVLRFRLRSPGLQYCVPARNTFAPPRSASVDAWSAPTSAHQRGGRSTRFRLDQLSQCHFEAAHLRWLAAMPRVESFCPVIRKRWKSTF